MIKTLFFTLIMSASPENNEAPNLFKMLIEQQSKINNINLTYEERGEVIPLFKTEDNSREYVQQHYDSIVSSPRMDRGIEFYSNFYMAKNESVQRTQFSIRKVQNISVKTFHDNVFNDFVFYNDILHASFSSNSKRLTINNRIRNRYIYRPFAHEIILEHIGEDYNVEEKDEIFEYSLIDGEDSFVLQIDKENKTIKTFLKNNAEKNMHVTEYLEYVMIDGIQLPSRFVHKFYKYLPGINEQRLNAITDIELLDATLSDEPIQFKIPNNTNVIDRRNGDKYILDNNYNFYELTEILN